MRSAGAGLVVATSTWEALSAIGSFAAAAAALVIAAGPAFLRRLRRPELRPELSNGEPHVRLDDFEDRPPAHYLRLAVHNVGRSEARRVRVTLKDWFVHDPAPGVAEWMRYDTDPAALHWVSMPAAREPRARMSGGYSVPGDDAAWNQVVSRATPPEVNLPPDLFDLVDLVRLPINEDPLRVVLDEDRWRGFEHQAHATETAFMLTVMITSDNAPGVTTTIGFRVEGNRFAHVGFATPPREWRTFTRPSRG